MEALRVIKTIDSDVLPELEKFKGKKVEIIILSALEEKNESGTENSLLALRGALKEKIDGMEFQQRMRNEWDR